MSIVHWSKKVLQTNGLKAARFVAGLEADEPESEAGR